MTQLSSTASSCATQWKMWHLKVFSVIYFIAVCAAQDASSVTKAYGKTPESTVLPIGPPPVPSLQSQSPLDVFPSEKVEFNCSVSGSSKWTFTWKVNGQPVNDTDPNLSLDGEGSKLTIKASQAHSGSYVCQGHDTTNKVTTADSNSLKLNVYENKPKPTVVLTPKYDKLFPGESVTFKCTVNVFSAWEYLWYHNGNEIQGFNNDTYNINSLAHPNSGQYRCKAKRGKEPFFTEESETTTLQVSDPPTPSLKVRTPWSDVFYTENVEMSCEVDSPDWTFIWFRDGQHVKEANDLELEEDGSSLNITSATQTHQGVYTCKAQLGLRGVTSRESNPAQVIVYDNTPKPTLSKDPGLNPMYVGENVKFTCKVNVSTGWEYQWYKDGKKLTDTSETIDIRLGPSDGGKYLCKASRGGIKPADSNMMTQDVHEIPVPTLELNTQWLDVFPTESVKFSCKMQNNLDWTYTWYRDGLRIQTDNRKATLSINSASDSDAGQYKCKGHLSGRSVNSRYSSGLNLTVYDKKPSVILTQDPEYKVMFAGESVSFSCHINVSSGWEYQWFKDGTKLNETSNKYSISSVAKANSGSYTCRAKRGKDKEFHVDSSQAIKLEVRENKPKPSVIRQPSGANVYTGESVSFKCELEIPSGWRYSWYKDEEHLPHTNSSFEIHNATSLNNGTYKCNATRDKTGFQSEHSDEQILRISEIPVPLVKKGSPWLDVFPNESVSLTCGMTEIRSDWTYIWYRDGQEIQPDDAVTFDLDGTTLSIRSASASHRGQYSCSGKFKSRNVTSNPGRTVTLRVYDTKPSIKLMQRPHSKVMHTGDEVFFSCHVNVSSGWEYLFYKDENPLVASGNNYSIRSVVTTDTGSYECKAKRGKEKVFQTDETQASRLDIEERPSTAIVLLTGWSEVFSTDSLILKCEVKEGQYAWNYTWSKEGEPINQTFSEKYTVTPHNNPEQSLYTCRGVRTARPFYSKDSQSFATKNLLLKRRVLLSISGCLFFGIIAVFIGCIALRVFHKPVDEYEKPEEAELFLTMAQLKDRGDAPSPMVDYVTDEALNAPSKEGEENGKICSESTPLPITSPEDEAATAENPDTAENGGGLVSFKQ
ncbi:obscurin [Thunnus albacares]|uniref:obscurin n=1 Tax=Thunnus albacares TaxID=8236 RepID=UPI001CF6DE94|nr:obscurin [Thunnus albacares]